MKKESITFDDIIGDTLMLVFILGSNCPQISFIDPTEYD